MTDVAPVAQPPSESWALFRAGDEARCPCDHPRRPGKCGAFIERVLPGWALKLRPLGPTEDKRTALGSGIRVCKNHHELVAMSVSVGGGQVA